MVIINLSFENLNVFLFMVVNNRRWFLNDIENILYLISMYNSG